MGRTVLLGFDGGTFTLLDWLMQAGHMPALCEFIQRGARAHLISTDPPLTPPAWTSIMTGRTPGNHGIFDFVRAEARDAGLYFTLVHARDIRTETMWSMASRHGRPVIAVNFPMLAPPRPVMGVTIPGLVSWRQIGRYSYPPGVLDELRSLPGFNLREFAADLDLEKKAIQSLPREEAEAWTQLHTRRERHLFDVFEHFLSTRPWQLASIVWDGFDKLCHAFWRVLDPASGAGGSAWERGIRSLCLAYFRQLDTFIARIADLVGDETRIFLVSDHGSGPTSEVFYVNTWLEQQGLLHWREGTPVDASEHIMVERMKNHAALLDWDRTVAYAFTPSSNGIVIRVTDRPDRPGIRSDEYLHFRQQLAESLLAYTSPDDGRRVVTRVRTREEAYPGPYMTNAPDLILTLRDQGFVSILSARTPLIRRSQVVGAHRPEGIFVAAGPGVRRGERLEPLNVTDVTPLVLHSLGLPIPRDLEGRVPTEVFTPSFLSAQPVRSGPETLPPDEFPAHEPSHGLAAEDEAVVLARLRALRYIEE